MSREETAVTGRYFRQPFALGGRTIGGVPGGAKPRNGAAVHGDPDRHLRDKIIAVLFTVPGERVNNPRFGVGVNRLVFETLNELTVAALEYRLSEGLRRDIGDELIVDRVDVRVAQPPQGELMILLAYRRRDDRIPRNLELVV